MWTGRESNPPGSPSRDVPRTSAPARGAANIARCGQRPYPECVSDKDKRSTENRDRDEPIRLPLEPETALRGLLAVKPDDQDSADPCESKP